MIIKNKISTETDKVISDTTMMFMACASYVLHERNKFGKQRIMQFIADIEQVGRENTYDELRQYLTDKVSIDFPEVETKK